MSPQQHSADARKRLPNATSESVDCVVMYEILATIPHKEPINGNQISEVRREEGEG